MSLIWALYRLGLQFWLLDASSHEGRAAGGLGLCGGWRGRWRYQRNGG
jgi:hypothetical protein